jgi:hypothetical protein
MIYLNYELVADPTISEISFPSLHTENKVTEHHFHTTLFAASLTFAWHETTGGSHGTA